MPRNRLAEETSPYLQQHKDNPVHWWAWGHEAFEEAKRLNKPVLLSIGYAACHWCHVMAHESFEDQDTADLMNEHFINIKVDREERPDVDTLYMSALQELGERGGWPLTMFLTPDGMPFLGGTYFPKLPRFGMPAFKQVLEQVARVYAQEKKTIEQNIAYLKTRLRPKPSFGAAQDLSDEQIAAIASKFIAAVDPINGGLRGAPKFPNVSVFFFLWKAGLRYDLKTCQEAVKSTLVHICQGGIYDHLGGGFARYTVDERWLVPHFEKMLYDNALLIELCTQVWKETQAPLLKERVTETIAWLKREMIVEGGGFASSYDADSEGEEGKYYVWTPAGITAVIGKGEDAALFAQIYDVTEGGNWEGKTILNRLNFLEPLSREEEKALAACRAALFAERAKRVKPGWDDKVLADWNGLAIKALAKAGDAFRMPDWIAMAEAAYAFVSSRMAAGDRLYHAYRAGRAKAPAIATDYANMIAAACALYQVTDEDRYLQDALVWAAVMERHYKAENGGYYLSADDTHDLIIRPLSATDDATPNANGAMLQNLCDLYLLTGDSTFLARADSLLDAFQGAAQTMAVAYTGLLRGVMSRIAPQHVVMAGSREEPGAKAWRRTLSEVALPDAVAQWVATPEKLPDSSPAHGKDRIDGEITGYFCVGPRCTLPQTDPDEFRQTLREERRVEASLVSA
jgi:uncharacterized protein YyaL (SSP411 family)